MAQPASDSVYVFRQDQPNACKFLPEPVGIGDPDFTDDMIQWQWGKTQRNTPRGLQASIESLWLPPVMQFVMAQVFELDTISDEATPALARFMFKVYNTGDQSTAYPKEKYMRTRPFAQMGEDTWGLYETDLLRTNGSYPSGHTAFGWATALALAEVWPELQDTILRRGFQFGENRIITGAHYQSDVYAGYMCGAAAIARAHCNPEFHKDLLAARAELRALKGLPADYDPAANVGLPQGVKFLNLPVDTTHYRYIGDLMRYWTAKELRNTSRGDTAIVDANSTLEHMGEVFGEIMGTNISESETPAIFELLSYIKTNSSAIANALKDTNFRKCPFAQLRESTPIPEDEEYYSTRTSYASSHTCLGWTLALVFAQMDPEHQDAILRRGYQYGYSRLIVGYHWASDIDAGRLLACSLVSRLHADPTFCQLYQRAYDEFHHVPSAQTITTITPAAEPTVIYDLKGVKLNHYPSFPGIYIHNGKKESIR